MKLRKFLRQVSYRCNPTDSCRQYRSTNMSESCSLHFIVLFEISMQHYGPGLYKFMYYKSDTTINTSFTYSFIISN